MAKHRKLTLSPMRVSPTECITAGVAAAAVVGFRVLLSTSPGEPAPETRAVALTSFDEPLSPLFGQDAQPWWLGGGGAPASASAVVTPTGLASALTDVTTQPIVGPGGNATATGGTGGCGGAGGVGASPGPDGNNAPPDRRQ